MTNLNAVKAVSCAAAEDVLEGARRATGNTSSAAAPETEVKGLARRRKFSGADKRRILAAADACSQPGAIGALLRREGIYSSHLCTWRKQRERADLAALQPQKRGPKADCGLVDARRIADLIRENGSLRASLSQAHLIIEVQKKVSMLLSPPMADPPSGSHS